MKYNDFETARNIASAVSKLGGRAYYVGGFVRDRLLGIDNKDIDIEVHGVTYPDLKSLLDSMGGCSVMGTAFGIFSLKGSDIDIALPRLETATGRGHRDFEVFTDPFIGPEAAARRRDFTVNALMQDVLTGEILDFFHGRDDLRDGVLRHVNDVSFAEDPLRVLRAAQFAARFSFSIAPETLALCENMDLSTLSRERVMGELEKALCKAEKPSVFFEVLREIGQLDYWFPELAALISVPQNPVFHPEGDVWTHTMRTLDCAAGLRNTALNPKAFMLSALCHDLGKAVTTEEINGAIHAYEHEVAGLSIAEAFLRRLSSEAALLKYVRSMTALHMRPNILVTQGSSEKAYMRMFDSAPVPEDLILLAKADWFGSSCPSDYAPVEAVLREKLALYRSRLETPGVRGADLIEAGFKPGPEFSAALDFARKLQLNGVERREALSQTLGQLKAGAFKT